MSFRVNARNGTRPTVSMCAVYPQILIMSLADNSKIVVSTLLVHVCGHELSSPRRAVYNLGAWLQLP